MDYNLVVNLLPELCVNTKLINYSDSHLKALWFKPFNTLLLFF